LKKNPPTKSGIKIDKNIIMKYDLGTLERSSNSEINEMTSNIVNIGTTMAVSKVAKYEFDNHNKE